MNVRDAIQEASAKILRRDAETLLLHVLRQGRAWLFAHPDDDISDAALDLFTSFVERRARHEPLQYLTGHQEFFGLDLGVTPDVLIPRPETEALVEAVLAWLHAQQTPSAAANLHLVDVGTGSGAIAIALVTHLPTARITALDQSLAALRVARGNAERLGLLSKRLLFLESDLLDALPAVTAEGAEAGRIDVIVSNPPYVPQLDMPTLQPEVRDFEPHLALFAGPDGLAIYRRLIPQCWAALRPGGLLALEFGFGQKNALAGLLGAWNNVCFHDDLAGIPRIVLAERP